MKKILVRIACIVLFLYLIGLLGYLRLTFNRSLTPIVWKQASSVGIELTPDRFVVNQTHAAHIFEALYSSGYEELQMWKDVDVGMFSVKVTSSRQKETCILMADARPFHNPLQEGIPDIIRIEEAQHTWPVAYYQLTPYMNLLYAIRHGYTFFRFTLPKEVLDRGQRDATWYKIPLTAYLLTYECKRIMWLDSDAFIRDSSITLEEVARAYDIHEGGPYMLLPQDGPGHLNANMGAFLIRNGSTVLSFLEEWWMLPLNNPAFKAKLRAKLHEQDTFNHGMRKYKGSIWVLCPKSMLTTPYGSFVRHFWAGHKNETLFRMEMARLAMEFVQYMIQSHLDT